MPTTRSCPSSALRRQGLSGEQGRRANRVYAEGKGEKQPVTGDKCKGKKQQGFIACLQPDRRVDIEVIGTK